jgi:hypothetical protein
MVFVLGGREKGSGTVLEGRGRESGIVLGVREGER